MLKRQGLCIWYGWLRIKLMIYLQWFAIIQLYYVCISTQTEHLCYVDLWIWWVIPSVELVVLWSSPSEKLLSEGKRRSGFFWCGFTLMGSLLDISVLLTTVFHAECWNSNQRIPCWMLEFYPENFMLNAGMLITVSLTVIHRSSHVCLASEVM